MHTFTLPRSFRITIPKEICAKLDVPGQDIDFVGVGKSLHLIPLSFEEKKAALRKKRAVSRLKPAA